jgi:hypothetical protein
MVQTTPDTVSARSADQPINQRKRLAKRDAKTMLALERAKTKVQKAQQKVAKAQGKLEARQARLHQLEEQMSAIQSPAEQV